MSAREVVIVEAVRTPVGRRNGGLSTFHPVDLLSAVQTSTSPDAAFFSPLTRAWELALGALVTGNRSVGAWEVSPQAARGPLAAHLPHPAPLLGELVVAP